MPKANENGMTKFDLQLCVSSNFWYKGKYRKFSDKRDRQLHKKLMYKNMFSQKAKLNLTLNFLNDHNHTNLRWKISRKSRLKN